MSWSDDVGIESPRLCPDIVERVAGLYDASYDDELFADVFRQPPVRRGYFTLDELAKIVCDPRFVCRKCARAAHKEKHLCKPIPLPVYEHGHASHGEKHGNNEWRDD